MRRLTIFFLLFAISFAGSLWKEDFTSPYASTVARKNGDIILIKIDEYNTATQKSQTDMKKDTKLEGNANLNWSQVASYINPNQNSSEQGKLGFNAKNNFSGSGVVGRSSKLHAQLTAVIYKVESDRYFIRGSKKIIINNEEEEISMEGVVRAADVQADNTVLSSLISEAVLKIKGYGNVANGQEKGFISKLFDWMF